MPELVIALTAAGAAAALVGVAISVGRTIRSILAERKLVKKIAEGQLPEASPPDEFSPWERKEILWPSTQQSEQGRREYMDKLPKQAQKQQRLSGQSVTDAQQLAERTRKWIEKLQYDNEEALKQRSKQLGKAQRDNSKKETEKAKQGGR
jgi:hypothetical protein